MTILFDLISNFYVITEKWYRFPEFGNCQGITHCLSSRLTISDPIPPQTARRWPKPQTAFTFRHTCGYLPGGRAHADTQLHCLVTEAHGDVNDLSSPRSPSLRSQAQTGSRTPRPLCSGCDCDATAQPLPCDSCDFERKSRVGRTQSRRSCNHCFRVASLTPSTRFTLTPMTKFIHSFIHSYNQHKV